VNKGRSEKFAVDDYFSSKIINSSLISLRVLIPELRLLTAIREPIAHREERKL